MEQTPTILEGYSDTEKGAYLGAIASLATADHSASEQELEYIEALCLSANLSENQEDVVKRAATEMGEEDLQRCLDVLKGSDLRFSLVSDMIAFAEADKDYTAEDVLIKRQQLTLKNASFCPIVVDVLEGLTTSQQ